MCIERVCDRILIVAQLRLEEFLSHECIEFSFVQLNPQTAKAFTPALSMAAHPFDSGG
jgi:hypothetical protein